MNPGTSKAQLQAMSLILRLMQYIYRGQATVISDFTFWNNNLPKENS